MKYFNDIKTRNDLADFLKISRQKLTYILYVKTTASYYTTFSIPKKNGEIRIIHAPSSDLKSIQQKLSNVLYEHQKFLCTKNNIKSNVSHAFEKSKNIITNARIHRNKCFLLNLDLKDFFDSFHFGRVSGFFEKNNSFLLPHDVAIIIAQLVCYNGRLPQGAPTSPIITNLICQILDMRLLKIAKRYKLDYTRYADDLTFSTNDVYFKNTKENFINEITAEISRAGFSINDAKTRFIFKDSRQEVTGLVVNNKLNINRDYAKKTKAMAHHLYTTGEFTIKEMPAVIQQLGGRFAFIDQIDLYNNKQDGLKHNLYSLNGREKQYRNFIFYRDFYANQIPLIITEGKTDICYLKAALMNLYDNYPSLIKKDSNGKFIFKIRFFRRTEKKKYFFGISLDGGDAMKIIYRHFTGKNNCPNLYSYFQKICPHKQQSPVILLYDNETISNKPLKVFLRELGNISEAEKSEIKTTLLCKLLPDSKLYLLTNPLVDCKEECEIEDLFDSKLLNIRLNGKSFSREDSFDNNIFYGKEKFSKYVLKNYQSIDFHRFIPLLNTINSIIESNSENSI